LADIEAKAKAKKDKEAQEKAEKEKQEKLSQKLKEKLLKARMANKAKAEKERAVKELQDAVNVAANAPITGPKGPKNSDLKQQVKSEEKAKLSKNSEEQAAKRRSVASSSYLADKKEILPGRASPDKNAQLRRNSPVPDR